MPHMEVVDRLWQLPVVESAWNTSFNLYDRVKNAHGLAHWTLSTAEGVATKAVETIAPFANKLSTPIHVVDMKLCQGLDIIEQKMPIVKEQPQQIYENAKEMVSTKVVQPMIQTASAAKQVNVSSLKDLSWIKANEILESRYGTLALTGLDSTSSLADSYLDYYLPEEENEEVIENHRLHPSSECEDKVLHTAHTVGRLSTKVGRRVYRTLSHRLQNINKQTVNEYLNNLTLVVQLTNYLNSVNQAVKSSTTEQQLKEKESQSPVKTVQNPEEKLEVLCPEESELSLGDSVKSDVEIEQSSGNFCDDPEELNQSLGERAESLEILEPFLESYEQNLPEGLEISSRTLESLDSARESKEESEPRGEEFECQLVDVEPTRRKNRKRHQPSTFRRNFRN